MKEMALAWLASIARGWDGSELGTERSTVLL
jgi:hypothetical protein